MCQPKAKGGKRCQSHQRGSIASIKTAEIVTAAPRSIVMGVFKDLRSEGKNFTNPTKTEVEEFANTEKFKAKYNPDLTEAERKNVIKNWDRSIEEDEPTGATFHAWKNVVGETFRRVRTKLATTGVSLGLAATLAACSTGGAMPNGVTSTPQDSSPAPSVSDTVGEGDGVTGWDLNDLGIKEAVGEGWLNNPESSELVEFLYNHGVPFEDCTIDYNDVRSDVNGEYLVTECASDYIMNGDTGLEEEYGEERAKEIKEVVNAYSSQSSFDSILVWDNSPEARQQFIDDNIQHIHSEWQDDFIDSVNNYSFDNFSGGVGRSKAGDYFEGHDITVSPYTLDKARSIHYPGSIYLSPNTLAKLKRDGAYDEGVDYIATQDNTTYTPVTYNGNQAFEEYTSQAIFMLREDPAAGGKLKIAGWGMIINNVDIVDGSGNILLDIY